MIGLSLSFYFWQNGQLERSIVPYSQIEKLKIVQRLFDIFEKEKIYSFSSNELAKSVDKWGNQEFLDSVKNNYIESLTKSGDQYFIKFIFTNSVFIANNNINKIELSTLYNKNSLTNYLNQAYLFSFVDINGEKVMNVTRNFDKNFLLKGEKVRNNFPVEVTYRATKEYLIKKGDLIVS